MSSVNHTLDDNKTTDMSDPTLRILSLYGKNTKVEGDYDKDLSVKCDNGTFVGKSENGLKVFKGIPFAKPPVGELRWKRPLPPETDDGIYTAYYFGKSPLQSQWPSEQASYYAQGEDCLYLNIWKSEDESLKSRPVMVFFHGGSYGWGGTSDPMYDGCNFINANPDIILITVGYRVGLMGFVDLSYLKGGKEYPDAQNLGILDQIEALRWIKRNIHSFGGNSDNITIFGESAGGGTVSLLPIIKEAKGLFTRVISESGSVALTFSKQECVEFTKRLVKAAKTNSVDDLMKLSEDELKKIIDQIDSYNNFPQRDGMLIPLDPYKAYNDGLSSDVDMLIGTNANEMNYWVGEIGGMTPYRISMSVKFENDVKTLGNIAKARVKKFMDMRKGQNVWKLSEFYNEIMFRLPAIKQCDYHVKNGGKAYMYYWMEPSRIPYRGACHAVELAYVFGNVNETIYIGEPADKELSDKVMTMWTNFARYGNPSAKFIFWPKYTKENRETLIISKNLKIKDNVLSNQRKVLTPLLEKMINPSYADLDYNVPIVRKSIGFLAGLAVFTAASAYLLKKLLE